MVAVWIAQNVVVIGPEVRPACGEFGRKGPEVDVVPSAVLLKAMVEVAAVDKYGDPLVVSNLVVVLVIVGHYPSCVQKLMTLAHRAHKP